MEEKLRVKDRMARVLSISLARTRALVHLVQPSLQADGELEMFRLYTQHVKTQLQELLSMPAAAASNELSVGEKSAPTQYIPSRWLLLSCYEAALSAEDSGLIRQSQRERITIALFLRLTADPFLVPANKHAAADCRMLYEDAIEIHRRLGNRNLPGGSALSRWVLGRPRASALRCSTHPTNPLRPSSSATSTGRDAARRPAARPQPPFGSSATRAWLEVKEIKALRFFGGHPEGYGAPPVAAAISTAESA